MKVTAARFLGAAASPGGGPPARLPEVAVAGRSNVGKSSLLNALLGRHGLARTSSTPGRTRPLNFFLVNDRCVSADLPVAGAENANNRQPGENAESKADVNQQLLKRAQQAVGRRNDTEDGEGVGRCGETPVHAADGFEEQPGPSHGEEDA